jgi:hypothetical protein
MKGPRLWVDTIEKVIRTASPGQPRVEAKWYGDGPMIEELHDLVSKRGLSAWISFPGNVSVRSEVLDICRAANLFVFCHPTPESPRCLIEALMCGLPILGFESAYAKVSHLLVRRRRHRAHRRYRRPGRICQKVCQRQGCAQQPFEGCTAFRKAILRTVRVQVSKRAYKGNFSDLVDVPRRKGRHGADQRWCELRRSATPESLGSAVQATGDLMCAPRGTMARGGRARGADIKDHSCIVRSHF